MQGLQIARLLKESSVQGAKKEGEGKKEKDDPEVFSWAARMNLGKWPL